MSEQTTDQELVKQVQSGNKNAFNLLVVRHQNKVMNIVSRYVKNSGDVADVTQEAFIKAYRALPNFRGESAFYTWLYRIAVNSAKNYLTSQSRKPPASDVDAQEADFYDGSDALKENASPEKTLLSEELQTKLFAAIESLPDDLRAAITLREIEGLSYEEIAAVMECPVGTVRSRIFRAREAIDKVILPLIEN
ncbi:RNA polymerase sigma-70 factor, ECF subfamily [Glaciecola punicea ACAM 611]|jgi:RNA polymerase sigma-70 factor (ECF subfamily)|uniref:RNA polymerase sigma-70 factor, ECF subfamily n=1 Tax=Glaciecola punicea ACAM 611 TaxID=1121923 RepID=H5T825_9ALTE|nr:RNA polymerase sigma factor RpoE [Glaciecola punicea]OFA30652.1 RNA polymerase sigma factor RpoE [Glaciecola punicea]GAB54452.1 RNA polymerase sigma-70 factor, ECF subfamily [Glaciecola punicea ACAM 611]